MRRSVPVLALSLVLGSALTVQASPVRADEPQLPTITVTGDPYSMADGTTPGRIPREIVGANHRWTDDGKGMWDPVTNAPVGNIVELSRRTGLAAVRYPGGTVANLFDFSKAVGPQSERGCQTSGGFANGLFAPTDSRFGPDEQERFADAIGGSTMIMVPTINRTAADAADYVEYMNVRADGVASNPNGGVDWAEVRAENGHPEPYRIKVWEYGNEPYLQNQRYWRAVDLPTRMRQFIEGGWQRQTADSPAYEDNDGLFSGCDLATRRQGTGEPGQTYRVRYAPIALPGDEVGATGVGDGPIQAPVLRVGGEQWWLIDDLAAAGPDDAVYAIDQAEGRVRFGDGKHGRIPQAGAELTIEYTTGIQEGFLAFRDAMKAVDPGIEVCAGWGKAEFIDVLGSRPYDCLGVHSYTTPPDDGTPLRYHNLQRAAGSKSAELAGFREQFARYFPDDAERPELIVTEYGTLNVRVTDLGAMLAHTLYMADLVAGQLESDVRISTSSNLNVLGPTGGGRPSYGELFGSSPTFVDTGRARMLSLYGRMAGGVVVRSGIEHNPQLTAATGPYDALRVVASCQGARSKIMVLNRDPDRPISARIKIAGAVDGDRRPVRVTTLTGASPAAFNTETDPDQVAAKTTRDTLDGSALDHAFGPHSITMIEISGLGSCAVR